MNDILSDIGSKARGAGETMAGWYNSIPEELRHSVGRGLIGAGAGAALTGGLSAASAAHDPGHRHDVKGTALLGALMGGTAGVGLPLGMKMLGSGVSFSGEDRKPILGRAGDSVVRSAARHPALLGGGILAGSMPRNRVAWGQFWHALRRTDKSKPIGERIQTAKAIMSEMEDVSTRMADPAAFKNYAPEMQKRLQALASKLNIQPGHHVRPSRLAAIPLALGAGYVADKYIRGDY